MINVSLQLSRFTSYDIKKQLKVLDTAKAMGHDNISAAVLKICAPELAVPVAKLFQYSYNTGIYLTVQKIEQGDGVIKSGAIKSAAQGIKSSGAGVLEYRSVLRVERNVRS
eukprot:g39154.t1